MGRIFGTDGAKGVAITELTCELAMNIGRAATVVMTRKVGKKPRIFVGKDTRISSDIIEAALCAGICSVGADAVLLGVLPIAAVAGFIKDKEADGGFMITASHNNIEYNGIKLLGANGNKLPDETEEEIERLVLDEPGRVALASRLAVGRIIHSQDVFRQEYEQFLEGCIKTDLGGIKVAIDCANGNASEIAEKLFNKLGAETVMAFNTPDGTNINQECGSMHMSQLIELVVKEKCDCGIAFDGDADRCLAVDENGELVDGDKIIAIIAKSYKERGLLKRDSLVITIMANIGFSNFAAENGITVIKSGVGERNVLEKMLDGGYNIGGQQNGHIIFLDDAVTADGMLTAARLLEILASSGKKMSELANIMTKYPQVMTDVKILPKFKEIWKNDSEITSLIEKYDEELGISGRILVRESTADAAIKIMAEGKDFKNINVMAMTLADKIHERTNR